MSKLGWRGENQPLLDIAETQRTNNVRDHTANFIPCTISHEDEFPGAVIEAIEHFTLAFKQTYEDTSWVRNMGIPSNNALRTFALP